MIIKSLKLINHRNYLNETINFHENTNILIGKNAQGKTNLLEAIYLCARGYSFKNVKDDQLINFDNDQSYLRADIIIGKRKRSVEFKLSRTQKKKVRINEIPIDSMKELKSQFGVVLFSPEELKTIKESPSLRRSFIDDLIGNNDVIYKQLLIDYNKTRMNRNSLLKNRMQTKYFDQMIGALDRQLVEYGAKIAIYRYKYILMVKKYAKEYHDFLTSNKEVLEIGYENNFTNRMDSLDTIREDYNEKLEKNRQREYEQLSSLYGPHRDDLSIEINGLDTRVYASQGQQRTAMLALKMAEAKIIEQLTSVKPVLLLDDVFSELDKQRARLLVDLIKGYQTIITTNSIDNIDISMMEGWVFKIETGRATLLNSKERKQYG